MKILQLSKKFPYPPKDGESIAIFNLTRSFHQLGHQVTLLAMNTRKHYVDVSLLSEQIHQIADLHTVEVNTDLQAFAALKNLLFTQDSYHIERFISKAYRNKLIDILQAQSFEVIQLEGLYLSPYIDVIRKYSDAIVVMRSHNIEFEIWERLTQNEKNPLKAWYMKILTRRLKEYELSDLKNQQYDAIVPITDRDAARYQELGNRLPQMIANVGMDFEPLEEQKFNKQSVFFIGALDWQPNVAGLMWFIEKVWPMVKKRVPQASFWIAGRRMPEKMHTLAGNGIHVLGEVEDARAYIQSKHIMVVPLFAGSGMRVKIIEGFALGKPMVVTPIAVEGIPAKSEEHLCIAEEEAKFAEAVIQLLEHPMKAQEMSLQGNKFARKLYDNQEIAHQMISFYQTLKTSS